jgi:CheY-like chemotaxis protein
MGTRRYAGIVFFIMAVGMLAAPVAASADKTAEVGRHGSFVAYTNGVVADTRTGLEWIAGLDVDTSFHQAVAWVKALTVASGRWRMPTAVELRTRYRTPGKLGYQVSSATGGEEAVAFMKTHTVDLLVLDMVMPPGMDGLETYERILDLHPGQKAIIASGYAPSDRVKAMQDLGAGEYIRKPYTMEKIGLAVRRELDRK